MNRLSFLLVSLFLGLLTPGFGADWPTYQNARFGYSTLLPPGLQVINRAADGSGVTWQTGTFRIQVAGANNPYHIEPQKYFANVRQAAGKKIVASRDGHTQGKGSWMEILYTKDSRRTHRKIWIASNAINTVEVSYGYRYRKEKEAVAQRVIAGFEPGEL